MLAFHAPPVAVRAPVTQNGKMAGMISVFQSCQRRRPNKAAASRRSVGIAIAPAMTLNRMYHCVPSAISSTLPRLIGMWVAIKKATINGNVMFTGNDAAICASGWAMRATRGRSPIQTPMGVQISVAMTLMASTRRSVRNPSQTTCSICEPVMSVLISRAMSIPSKMSHPTAMATPTHTPMRRSNLAGAGVCPEIVWVRFAPSADARSEKRPSA